MMNKNKVLEILNNGDYIKIEDCNDYCILCPFAVSSYTVTMKEGGKIRITKINITRYEIELYKPRITKIDTSRYEIELFIPDEKERIEFWAFSKKRKGWFVYEYVKDPLYDEVEETFNNLEYNFKKEKRNYYSKYFPQ